MAKIGRPSKLTPETKHRLFEALKRGAHLETACQCANISFQTLRDWIKKGESAKTGEFFEFSEEVNKTIADAEIALVSKIRIASEDDWKAASWILERRHSDRWANTQRVKVEVEKQVEAEMNLLFEAIASDPDIPTDAKRKIFEAASNIQARQEMAGAN